MATRVEGHSQTQSREIHRAEVNGIPLLWANAPGPFAGGIVFRVGWADETLATSGITHAVEHLAMFPLGQIRYEHNATVEATHTSFWAAARPEEVTDFLARVTTSLRELPLDRLENELRVLQTEDAGMSAGAVDSLKRDRFGARGHGLWLFRQFGLERLGPDDVAAWARERFTVENAIVWMSGPPPEGFSLDLPRGERIPPPEPELNEHEFPVFVLEGSKLVALTLLGKRSAALTTALHFAEQRIERALRYDQGITYGVSSWYEPLTPSLAHFALTADCLDEHAQQVVDGIVGVFDEIARDGLTDDELRDNVDEMKKVMSDPETLPGFLMYSVDEELDGAPPRTEEELLREHEGITRESSASAIRDALESLIMLAPRNVEPDEQRFNPVPSSSPDRIVGKTYKPKGLFGKSDYTPVVVGDEGAMCVFSNEQVITVPFAECVAVLERPDTVTLFRADGSTIELHLAEYRGGPEMLDKIRERVPPEKIVRLDGAA